VDVPRDLEKIIVRSLRNDPGRRYRHAGGLEPAFLGFLLGKLNPSEPGDIILLFESRRFKDIS
jgi:hypothetical protein